MMTQREKESQDTTLWLLIDGGIMYIAEARDIYRNVQEELSKSNLEKELELVFTNIKSDIFLGNTESHQVISSNLADEILQTLQGKGYKVKVKSFGDTLSHFIISGWVEKVG